MQDQVHTVIRPGTNIMAAASTENSRYAMRGALPITGKEPESGWLVATDGRMMAAAPAHIEHPGGRPAGRLPIIPVDAIPHNARSVELNGRIVTHAGTVKKPKELVNDSVEGTFPPCEEIPPKCKDDTVWLHLNPAMLAALASALSLKDSDGRGIYIGFNGPTKPLAIMDETKSALGVLMPISQSKPAAETSMEYNALAARFKADWLA